MTQASTKRKKRKKNILPYLLSVVLIVFMVIGFFQSKQRAQTYLISSKMTYRHRVQVKSLVIRNERILPYEAGSVNNKLLNQPLPVGTALGGRMTESGRRQVQARIEAIDAEIYNLNIEAEEKDKQSPVDDIIHALRSGNYEDNARYVAAFQDAMTYSKVEKKRVEKALNSEKAYYTALLEQNEASLLSAGILVQGTDGYEQVFRTDQIDRIRASDYVVPITDPDQLMPVYKVVDSHKWYLCVVVPIFNNTYFTEGQTFSFDYEGVTYSGTIVAQETTLKDQSFVVEMLDGLQAFINVRSVDITVLYPEEKAFSLPKEALSNRGDVLGVYKRYRLNQSIFVPLTVLKEDKDTVIVDAEPEKDQVQALELYDEIWLHPQAETVTNEEDI